MLCCGAEGKLLSSILHWGGFSFLVPVSIDASTGERNEGRFLPTLKLSEPVEACSVAF